MSVVFLSVGGALPVNMVGPLYDTLYARGASLDLSRPTESNEIVDRRVLIGKDCGILEDAGALPCSLPDWMLWLTRLHNRGRHPLEVQLPEVESDKDAALAQCLDLLGLQYCIETILEDIQIKILPGGMSQLCDTCGEPLYSADQVLDFLHRPKTAARQIKKIQRTLSSLPPLRLTDQHVDFDQEAYARRLTGIMR